MKCPIDGATLTMSERSGIEIDYCPECRGVWLDRGELDKILDRAAAEDRAAAPPQQPAAPAPPPAAPQPGYGQPSYQQPAYGGRYYDDSDKRYYGGGYKKRKGHWLGELFDFDVWIGWIELDLLLGDVRSLKQKRSLVRPIVAEVRRRFDVSAAEVGHLDLYRRTLVGASVVAADRAHVVEVLDAVEKLVAWHPEVEVASARRGLRTSDDE